MKKNGKLLLILAVLLIVIGGICLVFFKNDQLDNKKDDEIIDVGGDNKEEVPEAPAADTKELTGSMKRIEVRSVESDKIEFSKDINIKEGEKIAVWVYSEPKFLGFFEVVVKNGVKVIEGLKEKLDKLSIEDGEHNIALATEDGVSLGYIDIYIEKDGKMTDRDTKSEDKKENDSNKKEEQSKPANKEENTNKKTEKKETKITTKEVVEEEKINYQTKTQKDANMKSGSKEVVTKGENGIKKVTYSVTYDKNGKEISRKKVSEKVTKEVVDEVVKVGASDFNLNTDYITGSMTGFVCTESQVVTTDSGNKDCNDWEYELKSFSAIKINNQYYVTCLNSDDCNSGVVNNFIKVNNVDSFMYSVKYNGVLYYLSARAGGGDNTQLTSELCSKYKISCGTW